MRLLIFADLHLGNKKDSSLFHDISLKYAEWLKKTANDNNITDLLFLGDFFHDRKTINLPTLDIAFNFMNILSEFNIHMICGNHDSYYNDNCGIHSLGLLKKWQNVHLYEQPTVIFDNISMVPWGTTLENIIPADIICGHFDIQGYDLGKNRIATHGFRGIDLVDKGKLVLSGHYHKPQERKYDKGIIKYLGSCFQLNWGESGEHKYAYILNNESLEMKKIKNDISPRFELIKSEKDFSKIENNFVKILVGVSDDTTFNKILEYKPLDVETELIEDDLIENIKEIDAYKIVDIDDAIEEYINKIEDITDEEKLYLIKDVKQMYKKYAT